MSNCFWLVGCMKLDHSKIPSMCAKLRAQTAERSAWLALGSASRNHEHRECCADMWEFPTIRATLFWVLIIRILYYLGYYIRVPYFRKVSCMHAAENGGP